MALRAVLQFLCALGVFQKGLTSLIETQQTVMAAVGEEAQLNCQLMQSKDVLQVTWQKLLPEGEKNLATYNKIFGQIVNPDFRNNVEFKCAGLQSSSIVIRKVTEQDEGCYRCLFNTYPEGALNATTCLLLYGLTSLIETQQTVMAAVGEEAQLNCQLMQSKDVLQVTWQKLLPEGEKNLATYNNIFGESVNPDFRNNVEFKYAGLQNSSIVIRKVTEQDEGCYRCLFNTYPEGALTAITCLLLYGFHEESETNNSDRSRTWIILSVVLVACVCVAAVIARLRQKNHNSFSNRDSEKNKTSIQEPDEVHTLLDNSQIRKRTTPEIGPRDKLDQSPSTRRRDFESTM